MVRVVRLERTVSWSQTRRDTNFAIPGYSLFCHDTTASGKNKDFSVCGHSCGQSCFCAAFCNREKPRKHRRRKALRRFTLPCPGYRHGTPKPRALPTAQRLGVVPGRTRFSYYKPAAGRRQAFWQLFYGGVLSFCVGVHYNKKRCKMQQRKLKHERGKEQALGVQPQGVL